MKNLFNLILALGFRSTINLKEHIACLLELKIYRKKNSFAEKERFAVEYILLNRD